VASLPQKIANSWQVWRAVRAGRTFARASRAEIEAHVSRRLSGLVQFAAERVPYYRDLFQREEIDPREVRSREDLPRLPVLEKEVLRETPERLRPEDAREDRLYPLRTSGTLGWQVTTWYDLPALWESAGRLQRQRDHQARLVDPKLARQPKLYVILPDGTPTRLERLYREQLLVPARSQSSVVMSVHEPIPRVLARIREVRPRIIATYGTVLEALAWHLREHDPGAELPFVFTYSSDMCSPWALEALEHRHGARVLSSYVTGETRCLAYSCAHRRLLHLTEDLGLVRVCTEAGEDLEEGVGQVIVTNLFNRQTVLINYRLGDLVAVTRERCACGTEVRCLQRVEGRTDDLVVRPDGELVSPCAVLGVQRATPGVARFQFVQEELTRAHARIVLGPGADFGAVRPGLDEQFRGCLGPDLRVEYEVVEEIPVPPNGKFRAVVSHVGPREPCP
jgi:phenylacetate-CoA ligase